jgi:hypothetical protein
MGLHAAAAVATALLLWPGPVQAQLDDFNDGNDDGWQRYSPLAPFGLPGVFSFPNGGYRIETRIPSGMPDNPGRAGSIRTNVVLTDFYIAVDVVNWKDDVQQVFGLLARIGNIGLGQTTGYAFTYDRGSGVTPTSGDFDISRIDGEVPTTIDRGPSGYHLNPAKDYRFVFIGKGPNLEGRVYELPNIETPVLTITATDSTYPSGYGGLVVYDNTGGKGVTDATFDNYLALPEEPPRLKYLIIRETEELQVFWPVTFTGYILESSPVLPATEWTQEEVFEGPQFFYHWEGSNLGNKFFRLRKPMPGWPP